MFINQNNLSNHLYFMKLAYKQANVNLGNTKDNPSVGCVIVKNNRVISAGTTSFNGRPHAEANAINWSKESVLNSTMYVTLEPCSHYGYTPPCINKIIKRKIKKVFFSVYDPDHRSFNKSYKLLKKNKINVSMGLYSKEIAKFYKSYFLLKNKNNLPFVTCKLAISKDYFTIDKRKKWITNKYSRARTHLMRSIHDCLITSSETIIKDNPFLSCRIEGLKNRSPAVIILDNKLRVKINSRIINDKINRKTIIFYNKKNLKKIKLLKKKGIKLYKIALNKNHDLNLRKVLIKAKQIGFSRIFLESGIKLSVNFLKENLVNELKIFISNNKIKKNGSGNIKTYLKKILNNKKKRTEDTNLFDNKLLTYIIK